MISGDRFRRYIPFYIMMFPALLYFFIFRYIPMYGVVISFKDFNVMKGMMDSPWAKPLGRHFLMFFRSPYFVQLIRNTMLISFYKLIFGMIPPIVLALLLNEISTIWFKRGIQSLSYMPHFLSWVIIQGILVAFLSEDLGLINRVLRESGAGTIPFLISERWFRPLVVISAIWKDTGWGAIIYLAAIAGIDPSLYDSGRIDGCTRMGMMWHITIPNIRSVIILLLILRLGRMMNAGFEQIYVMYNPLVYSVGDILDTWVYRTGLEQLNFSLASAVGLFKSGIGLILILSTNALAKTWGENVW
jgi:putative aldouronate transport system permease protein